MNYLQFALFGIFIISAATCGAGCYAFIDSGRKTFLNRSIFLGEILLLGSIILVGEILLVSFFGAYKAAYLWAIVLINCCLILLKKVRINLGLIIKRIRIFPAEITFLIIICLFVFRNCYFLVDIDSITSYLFTHKLWLSSGTSLTGSIADNLMIFFPQFDALPYGLGLSIFGQETLFPQLINLFWRLIAIILIFGYTSFRFNKFYGLGAAMFTVFNDHFFYSGVNQCVIINGTVVAFLFAASYNFWEAKIQNNPVRFILALIFSIQLIANKYQMLYVSVFLIFFGIIIAPLSKDKIKELITNKKAILALIISALCVILWYLKNYLITGVPTYPIFAGKLKMFNWTLGQEEEFIRFFGGLKLSIFIKYMSYLFIWPGINAAKIVIIVILFLPLIIYIAIIKSKFDNNTAKELCFWLAICVLSILGICLASHWDPRYYRYCLGVLSFTSVLSLHFILKYNFAVKNKLLLGAIILLVPFWGGVNEGYKIIFSKGGVLRTPDIKENIDVLLNRIHTDSAMKKYYPEILAALNDLSAEDRVKLNKSAWGMGTGFNFPFFLLPIRPAVSLWRTTIIKWDSYDKEELVIHDLKEYGIDWVVKIRGNKMFFASIAEYAKEAVNFVRKNKVRCFDYGFPAELSILP